MIKWSLHNVALYLTIIMVSFCYEEGIWASIKQVKYKLLKGHNARERKFLEHAKIQAVYNLQPLKRKFQQHVSII